MPAYRSRLIPSSPGRGANDALERSLAQLRRELDFPGDFPADVAAEAARAAREVPVAPSEGLADLRDIELLTVDPVGSTDLDQALHLERTTTGAVLHYAIADVPAFVEPGGALDAETRRRGQTLYAPDGRVPLHPPVLSEDAASLLPNVDRRAFVWRFELDEGARPIATTLTRAVVRSGAQWSYVDAQRAIDGGAAPASLLALRWFGDARRERERERGGASLDMPEQVIERDASGYRLALEAALPIERDNAQLSLLTGMAAADIMLRGGVGILRTMPAASPEAIERFRSQTVALGLPWATGETYGAYLARLDDSPAALAVREQAASLFRGAGYLAFGTPANPTAPSPANALQSAIGAPYAHTTAPLRRLVDRFVLTICHALANGLDVPAWARDALPDLPAIMTRTSQLASALDRGAVDRVEAAVLSARIGETFDAIVLSRRGETTSARVRLVDPPVEAEVVTAAPAGSRIRVRAAQASIPDGTVALAEVAP